MRLLGGLQDHYDELWKAIIRPPRDRYDPVDLGPTAFHIGGKVYRRTDLELLNGRNQRLLCSHFEPSPEVRTSPQIPCIVYLHGNCSSRLEALASLPLVLSLNCSLFCFDFAGSGHSDGEYVSLGFYERDDLSAVVDYLRSIDTVSAIGLWGRSMGAATALLHGPRDPAIAGMVLDSPFADLRQLADELVYHFVSAKIPKFLVSLGLSFVRSSIKARADFDIHDLSPIAHVHETFIPALFAAADHDSFIRPDHARALHDRYAGDKNLVFVPGEHNSPRPRFFLDSVAIFFVNTLRITALASAPNAELRPPSFLKPRALRGLDQRPDEARIHEEDLLRQALEASLVDQQPQPQSQPQPQPQQGTGSSATADTAYSGKHPSTAPTIDRSDELRVAFRNLVPRRTSLTPRQLFAALRSVGMASVLTPPIKNALADSFNTQGDFTEDDFVRIAISLGYEELAEVQVDTAMKQLAQKGGSLVDMNELERLLEFYGQDFRLTAAEVSSFMMFQLGERDFRRPKIPVQKAASLIN